MEKKKKRTQLKPRQTQLGKQLAGSYHICRFKSRCCTPSPPVHHPADPDPCSSLGSAAPDSHGPGARRLAGLGLTCLQPSHTHGGHGRAEFSTAASELAVAPMLTEEQGHSVAVWGGGNKKKSASTRVCQRKFQGWGARIGVKPFEAERSRSHFVRIGLMDGGTAQPTTRWLGMGSISRSHASAAPR